MTDQPTRDQLIEQAARVIHAARYTKADEPTAVDEFIAAGLADAGLLADPEQRAELEKLREQRKTSLEINQGWVAYRERTKVRRRELLDKIAELTRDRDRLSLLLRAMARKLVAYRRWADGDVPTVYKLRAENERLRSELRVAQVGEKFGKVAVVERDQARAALESTQDALREMEQKRDAWKVAAGVDYRDLDVTPEEARAERDALQARLDAVLAVLDEPVPETPHGANAMWKVQNHRAVQVQRLRAALQGDQPTEEVHGG